MPTVITIVAPVAHRTRQPLAETATVADEQLSGLDFTDDLMMTGIYQSLKGVAGAVRDRLYEVIQ